MAASMAIDAGNYFLAKDSWEILEKLRQNSMI